MTSTRTTQHHFTRRPLQGVLAAMSLLFLLVSGFSTAYASPRFSLVTLPDSVAPQLADAQLVGHHISSMTVALLLATRHQEQQQSLIKALYTPRNPLYHQWLHTGEFDARFGPTASDVAAAQKFLTQAGLRPVADSSSSTLQLATGTVSQVEAAFHTVINDYRTPDGQRYFANSTSVHIPANLSGNVTGVLGLTDVDHARTHLMASEGQGPNLSPPYGAGPFGRGLTPSQISGIYGADPVYKNLRDRGQGITTAVFELSGYTRKDIDVYKRQFGLPNVPVVDRPVYGGPIPVNGSLDYAADEVQLDIDLQIALAPGIQRLLIYNAPNLEIGIVAEYLQMARDNLADAISSSWGICEYLYTSSGKLGEFQAFTQMAVQGQSIFSSSGDSGSFDCLPYKDKNLQGSNALQVDDPAGQPYMTAVGGTSFSTPRGGFLFNPGKNPHPTYPGTAKEWTWNRGCTPDACNGADGGGVSRYWGSPDYQSSGGQAVPGFIEPGFTQLGSYCNQTAGVFCRELPDVSLDANPTTGYAIYCSDKGSDCLNPMFSARGWIRFGGTSCSAPLWAAIAALIDRHNGGRQGLLNYYFYAFDSPAGFTSQFHDISNIDNGYYSARPAYDMATGLGTADIYHLVKP